MNHTERIAETARCHRFLSRRLVKEAVEIYFTSRAKRGKNVSVSGFPHLFEFAPLVSCLEWIANTSSTSLLLPLTRKVFILPRFSASPNMRKAHFNLATDILHQVGATNAHFSSFTSLGMVFGCSCLLV